MKAEDLVQQEIFRYYWNTYCLPKHQPREFILHIPNEGKDNGKLASIGLYSGASDIVFSCKGIIYFCEVKTVTGTQSPNQKKFETHVTQSGFTYFLVRSLEDFKKFLEKVL